MGRTRRTDERGIALSSPVALLSAAAVLTAGAVFVATNGPQTEPVVTARPVTATPSPTPTSTAPEPVIEEREKKQKPKKPVIRRACGVTASMLPSQPRGPALRDRWLSR